MTTSGPRAWGVKEHRPLALGEIPLFQAAGLISKSWANTAPIGSRSTPVAICWGDLDLGFGFRWLSRQRGSVLPLSTVPVCWAPGVCRSRPHCVGRRSRMEQAWIESWCSAFSGTTHATFTRYHGPCFQECVCEFFTCVAFIARGLWTWVQKGRVVHAHQSLHKMVCHIKYLDILTSTSHLYCWWSLMVSPLAFSDLIF